MLFYVLAMLFGSANIALMMGLIPLITGADCSGKRFGIYKTFALISALLTFACIFWLESAAIMGKLILLSE